MTDNEIIKALECHSNDFSFCMMCPFTKREECSCELSRNALNLINRQKTEIERLNNTIYTFEKHFEFVKAEAVRKFAEKLKEETIEVDVSYGYGREHYTEAVAVIRIDNLVKEMVDKNND